MTALAEPDVYLDEIAGPIPARVLTAADALTIDIGVPYEIQDGALLIMPPPSVWHQAASHKINVHLEARHAGAIQDVKIAVGENARQPDVIGLSVPLGELVRKRVKLLEPGIIELAVEIISHDDVSGRDRISVHRDRVMKFQEYAAAGISEYWIVDEIPDDPMDAMVEIYRLDGAAYAKVRELRLSELLEEKP